MTESPDAAPVADAPADAPVVSPGAVQVDTLTMFSNIAQSLAQNGVHPNDIIDGLGSALVGLVIEMSPVEHIMSNWTQIASAITAYVVTKEAECVAYAASLVASAEYVVGESVAGVESAAEAVAATVESAAAFAVSSVEGAAAAVANDFDASVVA